MKKIGCTKTRGLHRSANATNGANAGSFILNSNNAPSNTNANTSSHLCRDKKRVFVDRADIAKNKNNKEGFGTGREEDFAFPQRMKRINNLYQKIISIENIKKSFAKKVNKGAKIESIVAYYGWAKHCNSHNLITKLSKEYESKQNRREKSAA